MKRWLPYPLPSALLFAMWMTLNQTLLPGHMLLGAALALAGGLTLARLQAPRNRAHSHSLPRRCPWAWRLRADGVDVFDRGRAAPWLIHDASGASDGEARIKPALTPEAP